MGVHTVQNHPDAVAVGSPAHGLEIAFRTQHGIRSLVVAGIVPVGGKAFADGIQVENGGAQGGDIVHFLGDALEIAAVEVVVQHPALTVRLPVDLLVPVIVDSIGPQLSPQIHLSAFAEPVREHLVDHGAPGPLGGIEVLGNDAHLPKVPRFHVGVVPFLQEPEGAVGVRDPEEVEIEAPLRKGKGAGPVFVGTHGLFVSHGKGADLVSVLGAQGDFHRPGVHRNRYMNMQGAGLPRGQTPEGGLECFLLAVEKNSHVVVVSLINSPSPWEKRLSVGFE